jgi:SBF-like CPA transporter family (DUF4137)
VSCRGSAQVGFGYSSPTGYSGCGRWRKNLQPFSVLRSFEQAQVGTAPGGRACGSKKSLASGLPIATMLIAGHVGLVVIPMMVFHQIQLMVCASLARRYAARRGRA